MECYATPWPLWRESRILFFFTEPSYPPSLFCCRELYSLFCLNDLLESEKRRVWKNNSLKLQEILIMKNYGITLKRGNYATSGRQRFYFVKALMKYLLNYFGQDTSAMAGCGVKTCLAVYRLSQLELKRSRICWVNFQGRSMQFRSRMDHGKSVPLHYMRRTSSLS